VSEKGLEGIVEKPLQRPYRPGERGWIKVKNEDYGRYGLEREAPRERSAAGPALITSLASSVHPQHPE